MNEAFWYIELIGAFALAISGALTAIRSKFDGFGIIIISFVTAIGGGTLRDVLLTHREVFWMNDTTLIYAILIGATLAIVLKSKQKYVYRPLLFFDAIGLGLFTVIGVQIGIEQNLELIYCIILGTMTGTFGGVIRDILSTKFPLFLEKKFMPPSAC